VKRPEYPKLRGRARELVSKFIAEEVRTEKYPREQAVAVGISRAREETRKSRRAKAIGDIMRRYR
jgi:hypothetical protein